MWNRFIYTATHLVFIEKFCLFSNEIIWRIIASVFDVPWASMLIMEVPKYSGILVGNINTWFSGETTFNQFEHQKHKEKSHSIVTILTKPWILGWTTKWLKFQKPRFNYGILGEIRLISRSTGENKLDEFDERNLYNACIVCWWDRMTSEYLQVFGTCIFCVEKIMCDSASVCRTCVCTVEKMSCQSCWCSTDIKRRRRCTDVQWDTTRIKISNYWLRRQSTGDEGLWGLNE